MLIKCNCLICNKEFYVRPSAFNRGEGKYCSRECYFKSRIGHLVYSETRIKISNTNKGRSSFWKGKKRTIENIRKIRETKEKNWAPKRNLHKCLTCGKEFYRSACFAKNGEGKYCSIECRNNGYKGHTPWNKGLTGEKSHAWQGGISYEPYSPLFNQQLKDKIRVRDNFKCQLCGIPELECNKRLSVHHIDYNKENMVDSNLISLCTKCHVKTNYNRIYWQQYFNNKQKIYAYKIPKE